MSLGHAIGEGRGLLGGIRRQLRRQIGRELGAEAAQPHVVLVVQTEADGHAVRVLGIALNHGVVRVRDEGREGVGVRGRVVENLHIAVLGIRGNLGQRLHAGEGSGGVIAHQLAGQDDAVLADDGGFVRGAPVTAHIMQLVPDEGGVGRIVHDGVLSGRVQTQRPREAVQNGEHLLQLLRRGCLGGRRGDDLGIGQCRQTQHQRNKHTQQFLHGSHSFGTFRPLMDSSIRCITLPKGSIFHVNRRKDLISISFFVLLRENAGARKP